MTKSYGQYGIIVTISNWPYDMINSSFMQYESYDIILAENSRHIKVLNALELQLSHLRLN